jgi:DNA-directed RNA polymerase specialized sigma24 family protein
MSERYNIEPFPGYWEACRIHAWLLRAEGLTYKQIAVRFGLSKDRVHQMVWKQSRQMAWALRRCKFYITEEDDGTL